MGLQTEVKTLTPGKVFEARSTTLFEKMTSNQHVANMVMGIIGRLFVISTQMGRPFEGVTLSPVESSIPGEWRSRVEFLQISANVTGLWTFGGDLATYVSGRGERLAFALKRNPKLASWITSLIGQMDDFCTRKSFKFRDLVTHGFITKDGVMVIKVKNKDVFDKWGR